MLDRGRTKEEERQGIYKTVIIYTNQSKLIMENVKMKRQFTEWINDEHIINAFEINGEDNYALIDEKSKIVYGIGHEKDGLYLDFTRNNRDKDIDSSDFIIVKISDNDYESIYHGKTVKIENYSTLI